MLILRPTPWAEEEGELKKAPLQALKDSAKLFLHKETHNSDLQKKSKIFLAELSAWCQIDYSMFTVVNWMHAKLTSSLA